MSFRNFWYWLFPPRERYDVYYPRARLIYHYFNGKEFVHSDPLCIYKNLMDHWAEIDIDAKVARSASKDNRKAHDSLVKRLRDVFSIKPVAEGGLGETETIELLDHFLEFCDRLKKNTKLPTTASAEGSTPSASSTDASPPTPSTLPSGSSVAAASTEAPKPSVSESP